MTVTEQVPGVFRFWYSPKGLHMRWDLTDAEHRRIPAGARKRMREMHVGMRVERAPSPPLKHGRRPKRGRVS